MGYENVLNQDKRKPSFEEECPFCGFPVSRRKLKSDFLQGHVENGFRLKEGRFRLDFRKKFFAFFRKKFKKLGGEALEQLTQRTSGRVQGHVGRGPEQSGQIEGVSANGGGL